MMKKLSIVLFISLLLFTSCSCDDVTEGIVDNPINNVESVLEQAKNRILLMGLDTTDMIEIDGYYVVENDILINKDSLFNIPKTRQYSATNTVATGQVITIGVDNSALLTAWASALSSVASNYTSYTGMVFKFSGYDPDADIVISKANLFYSNVCAEGEFPVSSNAKPGKHVRINSVFYKNIDTYLSTNEKIFLMMHEIGHNLGLRHTNCAVNGEGASDVGMVKIPGTPDTDSDSYMNSATCGNSWTGMPKYDAVALKYLFPVVYCTIHFENCTGVSDIKFKKGTEYELSRRLIPQKEGYVFAGWYYGLSNPYIPAIDYSKAITNNLTLYAKWRSPHDLITISGSSFSSFNNKISFSLTNTTVVTLHSKVIRGLNEWSDIRSYHGTLSKIENQEYPDKFIYEIPMEGYMYNLNAEQYVEHSEQFVLEAGDYYLISSFTDRLGEQNEANSKHGSVYTTLSYY